MFLSCHRRRGGGGGGGPGAEAPINFYNCHFRAKPPDFRASMDKTETSAPPPKKKKQQQQQQLSRTPMSVMSLIYNSVCLLKMFIFVCTLYREPVLVLCCPIWAIPFQKQFNLLHTFYIMYLSCVFISLKHKHILC